MRVTLVAMTPVVPSVLATVPKTGIYAWWDLGGAITWPADFHGVDTSQPLYVGLAEKGGLDERGVNMHLKTTRMSGLRRNLVALLRDELDLLGGVTAHPNRKMSLTKPLELRLTAWIRTTSR